MTRGESSPLLMLLGLVRACVDVCRDGSEPALSVVEGTRPGRAKLDRSLTSPLQNHPGFAEGGAPGLQWTTEIHGFYLLFQLATFVPVDVAERFVIMCNYTGKEVV
jgi:hypothetical protein